MANIRFQLICSRSLILTTLFLTPLMVLALNAPLVDFSTSQGQIRLARSKSKAAFGLLAMNYEPQINKLFCGPSSAAIVLNALRKGKIANENLPVDGRDFENFEFHNLPNNFSPFFARYTQKTVFNEFTNSVKTMSEVLGATKTSHVGDKPDFGFSVRQLANLLEAHHLKVNLQIVDEKLNFKTLKKEMIRSLNSTEHFVIVNFLRTALDQKGGGHFSPIGAYDQQSDSFLILDVNPSSESPWIWVNASDLIAAMNTKDTTENRGLIIVSEDKSYIKSLENAGDKGKK